ncbi:MAG: hypothetical protein ACQEQL_08075 [Pseudomonadota bacterium]
MIGVARTVLICVFLIAILGQINYNLPVYKQIFAAAFYQQVEAKEIRSGFVCTTGHPLPLSLSLPLNLFDLRNGTVSSNLFEYEVDGQSYQSRGYSYIRNALTGCNDPKITTAYYFPPYPQWAVMDNSFPEGMYWQKFLTSTLWMSMIALFSLFGALVLGRKIQQRKAAGFNAFHKRKMVYHLSKADENPKP